MALEVSLAACRAAGCDPATLPSVFASTHGDLAITDYMCETLATDPTAVSPTKFHNSVHNAAAGYWTIGYGRLCKPDHPPINEEDGEMYLRQDLRTALTATLRYCPALATEPEERLAAIVDFTFNLGAGRLQTSNAATAQ